MIGYFYASLGYLILFILLFLNFYAVFASIRGNRIILGLLIVFTVLFTTIFSIITNSSCFCLMGNDVFRNITQWFMEDVLSWVGSFMGIWIFFIAFNAYVRGERSIAPRILVEITLNLVVAFLWGIMVSSIITFVVCPLICEQYLEWDVANQKIWAAVRRWFGISP
ncbi:MAG: hypothetical protein WD426_13850 [Anditalea sp.]